MARYKLLILDEDKDDLIILSELLPDDSFEIIGILNEYPKVEFLANSSDIPDVIIMNFKLSNKPSWELIKEIRAHEQLRGILIIVLSVINPKLIIYNGLLSQADAVILKPFKHKDFLPFVKKIKTIVVDKLSHRDKPTYSQ